MNKVPAKWNGDAAVTIPEYDATRMLNSPFKVLLMNSIKQILDENGNVEETIIPDPSGLAKAVAQARVLHPHKLNGLELKFIRSALGMKAIDLAKAIAVSPEHLSRVEAGKAVLSPQGEMVVRVYAYLETLPATAPKNIEKLVKQVGGVFGSVNVQPCHDINDVVIVRVGRVPVQASSNSDDDGAWDSPVDRAA